MPPSANAKELFRGFSYVAPMLLEGEIDNKTPVHVPVRPRIVQFCLDTDMISFEGHTNAVHLSKSQSGQLPRSLYLILVYSINMNTLEQRCYFSYFF